MDVRVVEVVEFGAAELMRVNKIDDPVPGNRDVRIDVEAVDLIQLQTQLRSGAARDWFALRPPYVPGGALVGRIRDAGTELDPSRAGRRVAALLGTSGACQDVVCVPADNVVAVPDTLAAADAASVLHDGPTALGLIDWTAPVRGEAALVTAGAGGMGLLLVQLLRERGVTVVATARGAAKLAAIRELGARAVDHGADNWADRARILSPDRGFSLIYDGTGGAIGDAAARLAADDARISLHGAASGRPATSADTTRRDVRGVEQTQFDDATRRDLAAQTLALLASGRLHARVGGQWPLDEIAAAHRAVEAREVVGRAVLLGAALDVT